MSDLEQAARQALDALETVIADVKTTPTAYEAQRQSIESLRQALENHESAYQRGYLDGMAKPCIDCADRKLQAFKQPKQEPVAWYDKHGMLTHDPFEGVTPLYTEPPKREWVGLTAADLAEIPANCYEGAIWADAKLKEKNT